MQNFRVVRKGERESLKNRSIKSHLERNKQLIVYGVRNYEENMIVKIQCPSCRITIAKRDINKSEREGPVSVTCRTCKNTYLV